MAVKARAYHEVREIRPPPSVRRRLRRDFTRATYRGGQIDPPGERVSVRYFFDFAIPFGHWARDDPVDPSSYYFRTQMTFETSDARAAWLNGVLAVGVGRIGHGGVEYRVHRVL